MQHRIRTTHVELAGRLLPEESEREGDGVEVGPGGEALRQIVQEQRLPWECGTWVSRHGVVYDRSYDPFRKTFVWSAPKATGVDPKTGHFLTTVGGCSSDLKRQMRLIRAIALAWVEPPRTALKLQACVVPNAPEPTAEHIVWVRTGVRHFAYEGVQCTEPLAEPAATDVWAPLRYQWRSICGEVVRTLDEERDKPDDAHGRYHVSMRGWVRSPHGGPCGGGCCTRGVRCTNGRYYASIAGLGAFWIDEAVLYSFDAANAPADGLVAQAVHDNGAPGDSTLANLRWRTFRMTQLRHDETADHLRGGDIAAMCASAGIQRSTAWSRIELAAAELPRDRLAPFAKLAPAFLRSVVHDMLATGELDVADPLMHCLQACEDVLDPEDRSGNATWARIGVEDRLGLLKLCRTLELRWAMRPDSALPGEERR